MISLVRGFWVADQRRDLWPTTGGTVIGAYLVCRRDAYWLFARRLLLANQ